MSVKSSIVGRVLANDSGSPGLGVKAALALGVKAALALAWGGQGSPGLGVRAEWLWGPRMARQVQAAHITVAACSFCSWMASATKGV